MAIIFCDSTATGANNGTSWTDAYTSLDNALAAGNIAPGDQVLVSGTFNETVTIAEAAGQTTPNRVQGDDKSGGAGVGVAANFTIDGQSTRASCLDTTLASNTNTYYVFKSMICTGATGWGVALANCRSVACKKCRAHTNSGGGFQLTNSGCSLEECQADGNGDATSEHGMHSGTSGIALGCVAFGNAGIGITTSGTIMGCESYDNGTSGTPLGQIENGATTGGVVAGCTVDGNSLNSTLGIFFGSSVRSMCAVNNIIYNCDGTAGIGMKWGAALSEVAISRNNLINSNTTNYVNAVTHSGEVTGAPQFTNEGGDDYTLATASPGKAAGFDAGDEVNDVSYVDIGAHQRQEAGGGGAAGIIKQAGVGGGMVG